MRRRLAGPQKNMGRRPPMGRRMESSIDRPRMLGRLKKRGGPPSTIGSQVTSRPQRRSDLPPEERFRRLPPFENRNRNGPPMPPFNNHPPPMLESRRFSPGRRLEHDDFRRPSPPGPRRGFMRELMPRPDRNDMRRPDNFKDQRLGKKRPAPPGKPMRQPDLPKRLREEFRHISPPPEHRPPPQLKNRPLHSGVDQMRDKRPLRDSDKRGYDRPPLPNSKRDFEHPPPRLQGESRRDNYFGEGMKRNSPPVRFDDNQRKPGHSRRDDHVDSRPPRQKPAPSSGRRPRSDEDRRPPEGRGYPSKSAERSDKRKEDKPVYGGPEDDILPSKAELKRIVVEVTRCERELTVESKHSYEQSRPRGNQRSYDKAPPAENKRNYSPVRTPVQSHASFPERASERSLPRAMPPRETLPHQFGQNPRIREPPRPWQHPEAEMNRLKSGSPWEPFNADKLFREEPRHGMGEIMNRGVRGDMVDHFHDRDDRVRLEAAWRERDRFQPRFMTDNPIRRGRSPERLREMAIPSANDRTFALPPARRPY